MEKTSKKEESMQTQQQVTFNEEIDRNRTKLMSTKSQQIQDKRELKKTNNQTHWKKNSFYFKAIQHTESETTNS